MDKTVFSESKQKLSENARSLIQTAVLGAGSALSAVAFLYLTNFFFAKTYLAFAARSRPFFLISSFIVIMVFSVLVALLLRFLAPEAAGSGIPQLKAAFWKEMGFVETRSIVVKFVAGVLSIAGGNSLGREGPSVYVGGGAASNLAGLFGISRRERRAATAIGAAAALAAAFNTPMAAITFVIEEIIGDFNSRYLGRVLLASVLGAFVVHALIGSQPAFSLPTVSGIGLGMYLVVPLAAALAALAGMAFQQGTLALRAALRRQRVLPSWFLPIAGGLLTWVIGVSVFLLSGKIGVFGLGYQDLSAALGDNFPWKIAGIMVVAKLAATLIGYGFGGSGGIFAPALFIGGMAGYFTAGLAGIWLPLSGAEKIVLAAIGMSAGLGAIVQAPLTSLLIVFEMTHQFELIPGLLIGLVVSQTVARAINRLNFYDALLVQDGHELHKIRPPLDLAGWQNLPVEAVANPKPVALTSLEPKAMRAIINLYPYANFPVIIDKELRGIVSREEIEAAILSGEPPEIHTGGPVLSRSDHQIRRQCLSRIADPGPDRRRPGRRLDEGDHHAPRPDPRPGHRPAVGENGHRCSVPKKRGPRPDSAPVPPPRREVPMTKSRTTNVLLGLGLALLAPIVFSGPVRGRESPAAQAREIVGRIDALYRSRSAEATVEMEVITPAWQRTLRMKIWTRGMTDTFIRILEPKKEEGFATLRLGSEMWNYLPKIDKVMKIPPSMMMSSWLGSDFTNDDLVKEFTFVDSYRFEMTTPDSPDPGLLYVKCTPKEGVPIVWGAVVLAVRKGDDLPVWERYYDERGRLVREMTFKDVRAFGNRRIPALMELVPRTEEGRKTTLRYVEAAFDGPLAPDIFTLRHLQGGR